jgi:hypothetical protein
MHPEGSNDNGDLNRQDAKDAKKSNTADLLLG